MVLLHVAVTSAYVNAAQALGATPPRVAAHHVASATVELLPATLVLTVRFAVLTEKRHRQITSRHGATHRKRIGSLMCERTASTRG